MSMSATLLPRIENAPKPAMTSMPPDPLSPLMTMSSSRQAIATSTFSFLIDQRGIIVRAAGECVGLLGVGSEALTVRSCTMRTRRPWQTK